MKYGYSDNINDIIPNVDKMYNDDVNKLQRARPELDKLLKQIKTGDTVIVKSLGCLAWGTRDVVKQLQRLISLGVYVISIDDAINTINQTYVESIVTAFYDIELYKLSKAKIYPKMGRKPNQIDGDLWNAYYTLWKNKSITKTAWANAMGINCMSFYREFKRRHPNDLPKQRYSKLAML